MTMPSVVSSAQAPRPSGEGKKSLKTLYVDCHLHSLNPSNTLMPSLVAAATDATFFGPGYVSAGDLDGGLDRYADRTGPYDAIFVGPNMPIFARSAEERAAAPAYSQRFTALASPARVQAAFFDDFARALPRLPIPIRIASLLTHDIYATTPSQINCLNELGFHVLAPDAPFAPKLSQLPAWAREEEHFRRKAERLSDAWREFVAGSPQRIITALHYVGDAEFSFRGLEERQGRVSVPGVEYVMRAKALEALRAAGMAPRTKAAFHLFRLLNKLGLPVYRRFLPLKLFNLTFFHDLIDTRFVYTARGGFGMPVRKFFEIPAAGAAMLCLPPLGFADLGFRDGVHYVEAAPGELPDRIRSLEKDLERAQGIATAGRKLVFERHSLRARARQIADCLAMIADGTYGGASWVAGEFVIRTAR